MYCLIYIWIFIAHWVHLSHFFKQHLPTHIISYFFFYCLSLFVCLCCVYVLMLSGLSNFFFWLSVFCKLQSRLKADSIFRAVFGLSCCSLSTDVVLSVQLSMLFHSIFTIQSLLCWHFWFVFKTCPLALSVCWCQGDGSVEVQLYVVVLLMTLLCFKNLKCKVYYEY